MTSLDPTLLTSKTQLRPSSVRERSRSPSRSPIRKAQFNARELDPLLDNLSSDATLKALSLNDAVTADQYAKHDALTRSIARASDTERAFGIKASLAAKKIREWHTEVTQWQWVSEKDCRKGKGFLVPPQDSEHGLQPLVASSDAFLGCLPRNLLQRYETRLEEIKDGMEALDVEELKDYILEAHAIPRSREQIPEADAAMFISNARPSHLSDFTAIITATTVQALPILAKLNAFIVLWDARIAVLLQIPELVKRLRKVQSELSEANADLLEKSAFKIQDQARFEQTKSSLSVQIANLGTSFDRLLDLLEGQKDSLPELWIEDMDKMETDLATWSLAAEQQIAQRAGPQSEPVLEGPLGVKMNAGEVDSKPATVSQTAASFHLLATLPIETTKAVPALVAKEPHSEPALSAFSFGFPPMPSPKRKNFGHDEQDDSYEAHSRHKREISKLSAISIPESTLSEAFSDLSTAEIGNAQAETLSTPTVHLVNNPFSNRASRDNLSVINGDAKPRVQSMYVFGTSSPDTQLRPFTSQATEVARPATSHGDFGPKRKGLSPDGEDEIQEVSERPAIISRASMSSIEMIGKHRVRSIVISRSGSLSNSVDTTVDQRGTPNGALKTLTSRVSPAPRSSGSSERPRESIETTLQTAQAPAEVISESPSIQRSPTLPRKSSKRLSRDVGSVVNDADQHLARVEEPASVFDQYNSSALQQQAHSINTKSCAKSVQSEQTLEEKIQILLTTIPARIKLTSETSESTSASNMQSVPSSRSTTPLPALTLSPVKTDRVNRKSFAREPGVRLFHLIRADQVKDSPPTKLFVRTVGDSQRVMVRVGGGWADLGEYLREYSLHHGRKSVTSGHLEVSDLPVKGQSDPRRASAMGAAPVGAAPSSRINTAGVPSQTHGRSSPVSRSSSRPNSRTGIYRDGGLIVRNRRNSSPPPPFPAPPGHTRQLSAYAVQSHISTLTSWEAPPVPTIPSNYQKIYTSPTITTVTKTHSRGPSLTTTSISSPLSHNPTFTNTSHTSQMSSHQPYAQSISAAPASAPHEQSYVPLGAAPPRANKLRKQPPKDRASSLDAAAVLRSAGWAKDAPPPRQQAFDDSQLSDSRRESIYHNHQRATFSNPTASSRNKRVVTAPDPSNGFNVRRKSSSQLLHSHISTPAVEKVKDKDNPRRKSMLGSLGDVGGIKRVFLRKKER